MGSDKFFFDYFFFRPNENKKKINLVRFIKRKQFRHISEIILFIQQINYLKEIKESKNIRIIHMQDEQLHKLFQNHLVRSWNRDDKRKF